MASIKKYYLKKSKEYRYEVFISNGIKKGTGKQDKIHKKGFKTYEEANTFAEITKGKLAAKKYFKANVDKLTIEEFLEDWITNYKHAIKAGTKALHCSNIRMYLVPYIGKYPLEKYTRIEHQKFINMLLTKKGLGRSGKGLSVTTARTVNSTISDAFKKAVQLGYVKENPTLLVEFPKTKMERDKLQYYTVQQADKFLEFAKKESDPLWYPFFLMIFDEGLRKGEAMGLEWHNINFTDGTVKIEQTRLLALERGENRGAIVTDTPKTPYSKREIPLTERTKQALLTYRNHILQTFQDLPLTESGDQFIFIQTKNKSFGKVTRNNSVNNVFNRIADNAELPHIRVHDGRHTFAVRLRQAGVSLEDIKDLLGHRDISTTQIYAHITPEVKERSMEKLEKYIQEESKRHSK